MPLLFGTNGQRPKLVDPPHRFGTRTSFNFIDLGLLPCQTISDFLPIKMVKYAIKTLIYKSLEFHNFDHILQFQPDFTILTKFHFFTKFINFDQISQFQPSFTISAKCHNFDQISQCPPNSV